MYRGNPCTKIRRFSGLGPVDPPRRGKNALRRMPDAGRMLVSGGLAPPCPHHPSCHCTLDPIDAAVVRVCATAYSYYSKYDPYLFNSDGKHPHGKEKLFHLWGYTVADAPWLQKELNGRQERSIFLAIINWEH